VAELQNPIPPDAIEAIAQLRDGFAGGSRLDRLIHRPCMVKVWQELAAKLTGPEAWERFLLDTLMAANTAEAWKPLIKPARKDFEKRRQQAARAGGEFLARLGELAEGWAGYRVPHELNSLAPLLIRAATRKRYPIEAAERLYEPLLDDDQARLEALIQGQTGPHPIAPADVVAALVETLEGWNTDETNQHPEQIQGTKKPQVFVRAMNRALRRRSERGSPGFPSLEDLPHGRLLTLESLARLTRAALDLPDEQPDEPPPSHYLSTPASRAASAVAWKPFNAKDVARALDTEGDE